jgi:hypothetical protein
MKAYQQAVLHEKPLFLAEILQDEGPIRIDVDLCSPMVRGLSPLYTQHDLLATVGMLQDFIAHFLLWVDDGNLVVAPEKSLICAVLEKPPREFRRDHLVQVKHGFHLLFPFCIVKNSLLKSIMPLLHSRLRDSGAFSENDRVIDEKAAEAPWLMYGSKKDEQDLPFSLSVIFDHERREMNWDVAAEMRHLRFPRDLPSFLSVQVQKWSALYYHVATENLTKAVVDVPRPLARKTPLPKPSLAEIKPFLDMIDMHTARYLNLTKKLALPFSPPRKAVRRVSNSLSDGWNVWARRTW